MENQLNSLLDPITIFSQEDACHLIFENIEDNFIIVDTNYRIAYANKSASNEINHRLGVKVTPGTDVFDLIASDKIFYVKRIFDDVLNGSNRSIEFSFTREDGAVTYFENNFIPARNSDKEILGVIISSRDISEKKAGEKALKEAEERWRFALEGANQGVWDWDMVSGKVLYSNSFLKIYGYDRDDVVNNVNEWKDKIHPQDRQILKDSLGQPSSNDHHYEATFRVMTKSGEYKWTLAKGMLIRNDEGVPIRMIGVNIDLTETLRTEEALRRTNDEIKIVNERFNIMMKATHDMIWDWDIRSNNFYRGEDGLKKVYGVHHNETIQSFNQWLNRVHHDDFEKVQNVINEILQATDKDTFDIEYRFKRDDGTYSHVYDRGMIIRNETGIPIRMIGAAQDISQRKKLENEILKNELEYQKFLNQATVNTQELERTEIGKELHDNVNQVLTTTKLYLDLARTNIEMKDDLINKSINNIVNVINEIRQLSRSLMDPTIDDLGIIDSIEDLIESINITKKFHIIFNADDSLEQYLSKNQKLTIYRIIQEALNNIIKHANATEVVINLFYAKDTAHLRIEDDGIGFSKLSVKKGAGLKNIQNRVYLINGNHTIETEPNNGCKIKISFPLTLKSM